MEALIDSGALACFLDLALARELNLPIYEKEMPLSVEIVNRTSSANKEQIFIVQVFLTGAVDLYHTNKGSSSMVSEKYQEFSDIFSEKKAYKLPKNYQYNCAIDLLPDMQPSWGPIYELSTQELETLEDILRKI
ncbi:9089_t:CDS:2 [Cetraspora pellucida]|uniref:9089_t:CDS:1 n=1 Tax=Cetraspora pellucida TaxID=1433469 RepID=A0A9N9G7V7_9GLOM|nr:9089_t:CDS:2 [Cetraspora pellucida]